MEEALEILWTYARREPLDSNGETIVPTINNSIAAIRIIMRLEGWAMGSEKRKVNSEKRATPAYATSDKPAFHRRGEWQFALCIFVIVFIVIVFIVIVIIIIVVIVRVVLGRCRGKVRESGVCEQFALIMIVRVIIRVVLVIL